MANSSSQGSQSSDAVSRIWTVLGRASVVVQRLYLAMNRPQNSPNNPPLQIENLDPASVGFVGDVLTQLQSDQDALLRMAEDKDFSQIVSDIDAIEFTATKEQIRRAQQLGK